MWSSVTSAHVRSTSPDLDNIALPSAPSLFGGSPSTRSPDGIAFVSVHAGAGFLHPSKHADIQLLLQSAINAALQQAASVDEAVVIALSVLESSPLTNAALGSCLSEDGRVECEASMVMGTGAMGSVGAVSGVNHSIQVAHRLAKERTEEGLVGDLGRIRPIFLVGDAVYRYAKECGLEVCAPHEVQQHNTTAQTKAIWAHYKDVIERHGSAREPPQQRVDAEQTAAAAATTAGESARMGIPPQTFSSSTPDTVGAIACDYSGRVCAGTSSGGIWMKPAGRLGSSAVPGAGCYSVNGSHIRGAAADEHKVSVRPSATASVSGCGEDITEQFLAMRCCDLLRESAYVAESAQAATPSAGVEAPGASASASTAMHKIMRQLIVKNQSLPASMAPIKRRRRNESGTQDTLAQDGGLSTGLIAMRALKRPPAEELELHFTWAHTSRHFAIGFAAGDDRGENYEGQAWISVQDEQATKSGTMKMGEFHKKLQRPAQTR